MRGGPLRAMLSAAIDWFLPPGVHDDETDLFRRDRLTVAFVWTLIVAAVVYTLLFYFLDSPVSAVALALSVGIGVICLCVMRLSGSTLVVGNLLTAGFFGVLTVLSCRLGGNGAQSLAWYAAVPVVALSTAGRRSALFWLTVCILFLAAFYAMHLGGYSFPNDLNAARFEVLNMLAPMGLTVLVVSLAFVYETAMGRAMTELRSVHGRLLREKVFSDSTIDSLPGVFYLIDDHLRLVRWNRNFELISGYSREDISRMHPLDFFQECDKAIVARAIQDVLAGGQAMTEATIQTQQGQLIPYLFSGKRLTIDGRPHLVGMGIDIAERKRNAVELALARDKAEAATRAKSQFLANMSHEIRTPMTAILGYADVLAGLVDQAEQRECVQIIKRNGDHLLGIINDILDLSKIEAGSLHVERAPIFLPVILGEIVSLMRVRAEAKSLRLKLEYRGPIPQTIYTDAIRFRQILINLVGNAVKFTETGEIKIVVQLRDRDAAEPKLQCEVIDTGVGLDPQELERLFQPFQQADSSAARRFGGTGLGLAISRTLAEALGGDITAASTPGQGSTFTLTVATGSLEGVPMLDNVSEAILPPVAAPVEDKKAPEIRLNCRILLAEDGLDNQRLICRYLRMAGAEVEVVEDGQQVLEEVLAPRPGCNPTSDEPKKPYDVILMDMQMPVLDGYETTRRLRAEGYTGPIIALTANAMSDDRRKCLDAGCDAYLAKPIVRDALLAAVESFRPVNQAPSSSILPVGRASTQPPSA